MSDPPDDRPPIALAVGWVSRITTVALEMVVPGLLGLWIDRKLGTLVLFTVLGFAVGIVFAIWQLIRLTGSGEEPDS